MTIVGKLALVLALIVVAYVVTDYLRTRRHITRMETLRWQQERQQMMTDTSAHRLRECERIWALPESSEAND